MSYTLLQVLLDSGAIVDQDASTTPTSTELANQISYADATQREWASSYPWPELKITLQQTTGYSQTSIGLPNRFDRLSSPVWDYSTGVDSPTKYIELNKPEDRFMKLSTDKYVYILGNDVSGRFMMINPPLASTTSLIFDYQATPSSLATLNDTVTCSNRNYMSTKIQYFRLLARSDSRFPQLKVDADQLLANQIEDLDVPTGGQNNAIPTSFDKLKTNFRIGG